ncbi:MAG: sensor histidine kinase [Bacilli bacterium]|nr:sensor histidine kinase [Bacilli bacterium]
MMTFIRHVVTVFLFNLLLLTIIGGILYMTFAVESISRLFTTEIFKIPFILFILILTLLFSIVLGVTIAQYWNQRLNAVERHLRDLNRGQMLSFEEKYAEIASIERQLRNIEEKQLQQVEYIQQLATKRAEEREKSLQEVVIQERTRLARDLHDSVSQHLFAASMMMSAVNETVRKDAHELKRQIEQVEKMIHQAQLEMRALLLHLRPIALKGKPLQQGIKDLLSELSSRLPIELTLQAENFPIEKGVEDQLFRIVQEAISNALRHAEANRIDVLLIVRDQRIILRIVDDGKGFDMETIGTGSYGLENMKERAQDLGGTCHIVSLPNKGTKVEVQVPIVNKEDGMRD